MIFQAYTKKTRRKKFVAIQDYAKSEKFKFMFDDECSYNKSEDVIILGIPDDDIQSIPIEFDDEEIDEDW